MRARPEHLDVLMQIQRACHPPELIESREVFMSFCSTCDVRQFVVGLIAIDEDTDIVVGYLLAHRWDDSRCPPRLHERPPHASAGEHESSAGIGHDDACCFIHDLAVLPTHRNKGYATLLLRELLTYIKDMPCCLVAVNDNERFWERHGFARQSCAGQAMDTYRGGTFMIARSGLQI